jgi:hypothetical protein
MATTRLAADAVVSAIKGSTTNGRITGIIGGYPGKLPYVTICAINTSTFDRICTDDLDSGPGLRRGTYTYSIDVPPGAYFVFGSTEQPTASDEWGNPLDEVLRLDVKVASGGSTSGVNLTSWFSGANEDLD